jgi:hypothetical protein
MLDGGFNEENVTAFSFVNVSALILQSKAPDLFGQLENLTPYKTRQMKI